MNQDLQTQAPRIRVPICMCCKKPCDVITKDFHIGDERYGEIATRNGHEPLSACCKTIYALGYPEGNPA